MAKRIGGIRRKTRCKLRKPTRKKGKISLRKYFQVFQAGDHIRLKAEPAVQTGMYHPRFHGKPGKVIGKMGACYTVSMFDRRKEKTLIVHPVHLEKLWQNRS